jgi:hypothetical protein
VLDKDLLEAVGKAMAEENERVKKLGQGKSKVATVVADESTPPPPDKGGGGDKPKHNKITCWLPLRVYKASSRLYKYRCQRSKIPQVSGKVQEATTENLLPIVIHQ